jgi:hypothetical protein
MTARQHCPSGFNFAVKTFIEIAVDLQKFRPTAQRQQSFRPSRWRYGGAFFLIVFNELGPI